MSQRSKEKRAKPEEILIKLRQVEVLVGQGKPRADAIRQIGVTEQTFYRWRKKYGGIGTEQLRELNRHQKENERLRRVVSDLTLDENARAEAMEAIRSLIDRIEVHPGEGKAPCEVALVGSLAGLLQFSQGLVGPGNANAARKDGGTFFNASLLSSTISSVPAVTPAYS